jgi:hypothetical protein
VSSLPPDLLADGDPPPRDLVEALREELVDAARMQRAYVHFLQKRAVPPRWRAPRGARWAAVALVVGVSSVYAATLIRPFSSSPRVTSVGAPAVVLTAPLRAAKQNEKRHEDSGADLPEAESPAAAESPPAAESLPAAESGSKGAVHEQPSRSLAPAPGTEQWKRAARGLRDGDFQSANAALKELTRRGTEADRESALLVQAQVLMAQGRDAEAGSLLKSLEASAHAPSVRRKSTELLARLRNRPPKSSPTSGAAAEPP